MGKQDKKLKKKHNKNKTAQAELADRHDLYEQSVQNVEFEVEFIADKFKEARQREARKIREDFCGTSGAACEWVKQHQENTAVGVDLDEEVLAWGRENQIAKLAPEQRARISLLQKNVLTVETDPVDAVLAMNFSYWCFKERKQLLAYFKNVYASLKDDGLFFMDAYGGYEAYEEMEEETEYDDFTYVWDQSHYNPVTGDVINYIHFRFPDGSELEKAFTYEWRLWSLPEIRELLIEAGFKKSTVYMQGWDDEKDEETDEFFPTEEADADPGWVAYITAEK